jgi:hypothetical protein
VSNLTNMQRKITFALGILFLFVIMYPYKNFLHREAQARDLGEATMGEVDTGSFMLKLALLGGARGIAANVLWMKTQDLQKAQDWDKMEATVNLITKLQPHFLKIWTYQGWNLAYNVSVEWDAPDDKYEWIKKGIKFLRDGVAKNERSPDLIYDTAWTYYHKIGFADEAIIFRKLFRDDVDESFKRDPIDKQVYNDNFQLAHGWFTRAIRLSDSGAARLVEGIREDRETDVEHFDAPLQRKRDDDLAFRAMPAHAQTRYAANLEKMSMIDVEPQFGDVARNEWGKALNEWVEFGQHVFHNPNDILDEKGNSIKQDIRIDDATDAKKIATLHPNIAHWANRWSDQMNYRYWKDRCAAEMEADGTNARQLFYEGTKAYKAADFPLAVQKFQDGLRAWNTLLARHQAYRDDQLNQKDTGLIVKRFARACQQLGIPVPKDTPFLETMRLVEHDNSVDPFDALEMISRAASAAPGAAPQGRASGSTGGAAKPK